MALSEISDDHFDFLLCQFQLFFCLCLYQIGQQVLPDFCKPFFQFTQSCPSMDLRQLSTAFSDDVMGFFSMTLSR